MVGCNFRHKLAKSGFVFGLAAAGAIVLLITIMVKTSVSSTLQKQTDYHGDAFIDHSFDSIIIFSSFGNDYKNSKSFYALILFMSFAMAGTFLASGSFVLYFLGISIDSDYFIALIWGNGDTDQRKK
jgi:NADH-quinone oxidoreductase subunit M